MAVQRILLALRQPGLALRLRDELMAPEMAMGGGTRLAFAGIVDPTVGGGLGRWQGYADIVIIGADELLWLDAHGPLDPGVLSPKMRIVVLVTESRILDVMWRFGDHFGLIVEGEHERLTTARVELAALGYLVTSAELSHRLAADQVRLDAVEHLSPNERKILACLGQAMTNKGIAKATGFSEREVKALVQSVAGKLRLKNRATIAVFAASNHLSNNGAAVPRGTG